MNIRKVLVTGSRGFVGRHLCGYLEGRGVEVFGEDSYNENTVGHH